VQYRILGANPPCSLSPTPEYGRGVACCDLSVPAGGTHTCGDGNDGGGDGDSGIGGVDGGGSDSTASTGVGIAESGICMMSCCQGSKADVDVPGSKAESEQTRVTRPQRQLRDHDGHRYKGAMVLNKLFMRLLALFYSISLDA